ncbi:MAG: RT0821/Lpp0805 family surface protein [Alphaproteobacteria bacterium]
MPRYDFETLMRYVDGELDDATCVELEAWLPVDVEARAIIADLRAQRADLRASLLSRPVDPVRNAEVAIDRAFAERARARLRHRLFRHWAMPLAASVAIAVIGGMAGYILAIQEINPAIDKVIAAYARDDEHLATALTKALEHQGSGEAASWSNPESGTTGSITPLRTFQNTDGHWCREFEQDIQSRTGDTQTMGIACRGADGQWRLVHERPKDI